MTGNDKQPYYAASKAMQDGNLIGTSSTGTWKEAQRVIDNMQTSVRCLCVHDTVCKMLHCNIQLSSVNTKVSLCMHGAINKTISQNLVSF